MNNKHDTVSIDRLKPFIETNRMGERCFRPLLCTVKAELGRGQPGLMRWIWDETLPRAVSTARPSTLQLTRLPSEPAAAPWNKQDEQLNRYIHSNKTLDILIIHKLLTLSWEGVL